MLSESGMQKYKMTAMENIPRKQLHANMLHVKA